MNFANNANNAAIQNAAFAQMSAAQVAPLSDASSLLNQLEGEVAVLSAALSDIKGMTIGHSPELAAGCATDVGARQPPLLDRLELLLNRVRCMGAMANTIAQRLS